MRGMGKDSIGGEYLITRGIMAGHFDKCDLGDITPDLELNALKIDTRSHVLLPVHVSLIYLRSEIISEHISWVAIFDKTDSLSKMIKNNLILGAKGTY